MASPYISQTRTEAAVLVLAGCWSECRVSASHVVSVDVSVNSPTYHLFLRKLITRAGIRPIYVVCSYNEYADCFYCETMSSTLHIHRK